MTHVLDPAPRLVSGRHATLVLILEVIALSAAAVVAGGIVAIWRGYSATVGFGLEPVKVHSHPRGRAERLGRY